MALPTVDEERRRKLLRKFSIIFLFGGVGGAVANYTQAQPLVGTIFLVSACIGICVPLLLRLGTPLKTAGNAFAAVMYCCLSGINLVTGGFGLPVHFIMGFVPMVAIVISGGRAGAFWMGAGLLEAACITYLHSVEFSFPAHPGEEHQLVLQTAGAVVPILVMWGLAQTYEHLKNETLADLGSANETLEASRNEAQNANAAKSTFLANMSHEIRTPMNGILGTLDLIDDTDDESERAEYLALAKRSAQAMLALLNEIVDLSKIESGRLKIERAPVDLRRLLSEIEATMAPVAKQKQVRLAHQVDSDLPPLLEGDEVRIRQVLLNLVGNALKFTSKGSVEISATISERTNGAPQLSLTVTDTGIGIAKDRLVAVFEDFTQADDSTTRKYGGTGLGLSISRKLIRLMSGELTVTSTQGVGSCFSFEIPTRALEKEPTDPVVRSSDPIPARRDLRVLVVDDNPVNRLVACRMLKRFGHVFEQANDGTQAVAMARTGHYDLILMDCQMPEMDGYEATKAIRNLTYPRNQVPVVAVTANAMKGDRERCLDSGMDGYTTKPLTKASLAAAINDALDAYTLDERAARSA